MHVDVSIRTQDWSCLKDASGTARRAVAAAHEAAGGGWDNAEVSIVLADNAMVADLNSKWRGKPGPTNVLSFPALAQPDTAERAMGDIVLALSVVRREAADQGKTLATHVSHLVVHGMLHLMGYRHGDETDALAMEALERAAMANLGFPDPYDDTNT